MLIPQYGGDSSVELCKMAGVPRYKKFYKLSDFSKVPAVLPAHLGRSRFESPALAAASKKKKKILNATGYLFLRFNIDTRQIKK